MINKILHYIKEKIEIVFKIKLKTLKSSERLNRSFELAFNELSKIKSSSNYDKGLTCVIFSKDRALQLYALLESINLRTNFRNKIHVIYKFSNYEHEKSYNDLILEVKKFNFEIEWVKEKKSFKNTLIEVLENIITDKIFFLTDDDLFINDIDFNDCEKLSDKDLIFSFRLSKNISFSYNLQKKIKLPTLSKLNYKNYYKFNWFETDGEWNYPWSVNGHVYLSSDIIILSSITDYYAPNSYEAALQDFNFLGKNKLGICPEKSFLINLPVNITQNEIKNKSGSIQIDDYLKAWGNKKKLDIYALKNHKPHSVHEEHILPLIDR